MGVQHYFVCAVVPNAKGMLMTFGLNLVEGHSKHVTPRNPDSHSYERLIDSHAVIHCDTWMYMVWVYCKSVARSRFNETSIQCVSSVPDDPSCSCLCVEVW